MLAIVTPKKYVSVGRILNYEASCVHTPDNGRNSFFIPTTFHSDASSSLFSTPIYYLSLISCYLVSFDSDLLSSYLPIYCLSQMLAAHYFRLRSIIFRPIIYDLLSIIFDSDLLSFLYYLLSFDSDLLSTTYYLFRSTPTYYLFIYFVRLRPIISLFFIIDRIWYNS